MSDSNEATTAKTIAETAIANANTGVTEVDNVLTATKSVISEQSSSSEPVNCELTDLRTKLTLKYFMLDIDIFNASTSIK